MSTIEETLALLRSDLADTKKPALLHKYPHLADAKHVEELVERIKILEKQIEVMQ